MGPRSIQQSIRRAFRPPSSFHVSSRRQRPEKTGSKSKCTHTSPAAPTACSASSTAAPCKENPIPPPIIETKAQHQTCFRAKLLQLFALRHSSRQNGALIESHMFCLPASNNSGPASPSAFRASHSGVPTTTPSCNRRVLSEPPRTDRQNPGGRKDILMKEQEGR